MIAKTQASVVKPIPRGSHVVSFPDAFMYKKIIGPITEYTYDEMICIIKGDACFNASFKATPLHPHAMMQIAMYNTVLFLSALYD